MGILGSFRPSNQGTRCVFQSLLLLSLEAFNKATLVGPIISVFSENMSSDMEMFAPNTTTTDEFVVEEDVSEILGILAEFQAGNKGKSTAGSVGGSGREVVVQDDAVVRRDLLVCQPCDEDGEVVAERKAARMYEYDKEEIDERPYRCKQRGCKFRTKRRDKIKDHLACIHDIGVTWLPCPQEGCDYKAKKRGNIKTHLAYVHDIGVTWHACPQEGCEYKGKERGDLTKHLAYSHDIGVKWHKCPQGGCEYKTKERKQLKSHLAHVHDIGVTWHTCPQDGCEYKAKERSNVKRHLASIHGIGVTWHTCPQKGCEYKAKQRSHINSHLAHFHGILP